MTTTTTAAASHTAPWLLFVILGAVSAFNPVAMDMYLPALPQIGRELGVTASVAQLSLSSFFIGGALGQFAFGPASDRFGRRPPLFVGAVLFFAASIGCALAPSIDVLIGMRLVQGFAASCGMVIARAVVFESFGVREGARYLSALSLVMGLAPIISPIIGGWVVVNANWRAVFYVVAGFAGAALLVSFFALPETRSVEMQQKSRQEGMRGAYLAILRNGPLMRMAFISALGAAGFFTYLTNAPTLLIEGYGIPADHFGYYFGANAFGLMAMAQVNRALLKRHTPRQVLDRSIFVTFGLALVLLAGAMTPSLGKWAVLIPLFCVLSTFPFMNQNSLAVAQGEDLPRAGAVSALLGALAVTAGAVLGGISSAMHDGTARPMAIVMTCTAGAALLLRLTAPKRAAPA